MALSFSSLILTLALSAISITSVHADCIKATCNWLGSLSCGTGYIYTSGYCVSGLSFGTCCEPIKPYMTIGTKNLFITAITNGEFGSVSKYESAYDSSYICHDTRQMVAPVKIISRTSVLCPAEYDYAAYYSWNTQQEELGYLLCTSGSNIIVSTNGYEYASCCVSYDGKRSTGPSYFSKVSADCQNGYFGVIGKIPIKQPTSTPTTSQAIKTTITPNVNYNVGSGTSSRINSSSSSSSRSSSSSTATSSSDNSLTNLRSGNYERSSYSCSTRVDENDCNYKCSANYLISVQSSSINVSPFTVNACSCYSFNVPINNSNNVASATAGSATATIVGSGSTTQVDVSLNMQGVTCKGTYKLTSGALSVVPNILAFVLPMIIVTFMYY